MRIFLSIKYDEDMTNRPQVEALVDALAAGGIAVSLVVRDLEQWGAVRFSPQALMAAAFRLIDSADGLLVEQSRKGTGLGIEAGYACARGIPVIALARVGCELSPTLIGISRYYGYYRSYDQIPGIVKTVLSDPHSAPGGGSLPAFLRR